MTVDLGRIEAAVAELLGAIGEDSGRPGLVDTPRRVAESYAEFFSGVGVDAATLLPGVPAEHLGDLVVVRDIAFRSICEHHLLPFLGTALVAYTPAERLAGLGDIAAVVDAVASRPQLQERIGEQVADAVAEGLGASGVAVVLTAVHACVTSRGPRQAESSTLTIATRGDLSRDDALLLLEAAG